MVYRNLCLAGAAGIAALPWSSRPLSGVDLVTVIGGLIVGATLYASIDRLVGGCHAENFDPEERIVTALAVSNGALWLIVIALSVALLAVIRQLGVLHERIAPVGALMLAKGVKIGESAPQVAVQDLEGRSHIVGAAADATGVRPWSCSYRRPAPSARPCCRS